MVYCVIKCTVYLPLYQPNSLTAKAKTQELNTRYTIPKQYLPINWQIYLSAVCSMIYQSQYEL